MNVINKVIINLNIDNSYKLTNFKVALNCNTFYIKHTDRPLNIKINGDDTNTLNILDKALIKMPIDYILINTDTILKNDYIEIWFGNDILIYECIDYYHNQQVLDRGGAAAGIWTSYSFPIPQNFNYLTFTLSGVTYAVDENLYKISATPLITEPDLVTFPHANNNKNYYWVANVNDFSIVNEFLNSCEYYYIGITKIYPNSVDVRKFRLDIKLIK